MAVLGANRHFFELVSSANRTGNGTKSAHLRRFGMHVWPFRKPHTPPGVLRMAQAGPVIGPEHVYVRRKCARGVSLAHLCLNTGPRGLQ